MLKFAKSPSCLALDEVQDVRMVDAQDAHVGAPTSAALLHGLRGLVEDAHERDRARGHALGGADESPVGRRREKLRSRSRRRTCG